MPLITQPYDPLKGAYIDVFLTLPESISFRPNEVLESTRKITLLLDTGASKSAISTRIADGMGLLSMGKTLLKSATHEVETNIYYVDLKCTLFTPPLCIADMPVLGIPFPNGWIDGVLGRDFFERVAFTLNGQERFFSLAY